MPPYLALALMMGLSWLLLFIYRRRSRVKMLTMSIAVIPFAFFDYFSQPSYWHPETMMSIPVGIEGVLFGFFFGGAASALGSVEPISPERRRFFIDGKHVIAFSPVLIVPLALYFLFEVNMMIALPVGLLIGILIIVFLRKSCTSYVILSSIAFGSLYTFTMATWLLIYPNALQWWDLSIYGDRSLLGVPLGEIIFGLLFGGFWSGFFEIATSGKLSESRERERGLIA